MMLKENDKKVFLELVRMGIGAKEDCAFDLIDWDAMHSIATQHCLLGVTLDGIEKVQPDKRPQKLDMLNWIGTTLKQEKQYAVQYKAASKMALLFQSNGIRTYVLKGTVIAECYPKPEHRVSVDMDCFLLPENGDFDAWSLGNDLIKKQKVDVSYDFYKNSTFVLPGLTVENHRFMVPFRGNKRLELLEVLLENYMRDDEGEDFIDGTQMLRPPLLVSSIFFIEHAYSHFLHEGLTWRHILDWMMFIQKYSKHIDWYVLDALIDEFGFRRFYDSYYRLGKYMVGEITYAELRNNDKRMLEDVWTPLDLHETALGVKGKLALVGNTWRARWKYHYYSPISMIRALWIQVKGVLFDKTPMLGRCN